MTEKTGTSKKASDASNPFSAFQSASTAGWMGSAWLEHVSDLSSELTSFVTERINEDVRTQHALMQCKSLPEVQQIQADFLKKALDQYQAETGKLVEMTGNMAKQLSPKVTPDEGNGQ